MSDYAERLSRLAALERRRTLRSLGSPQGARIRLDGKDLISFSSNDYLGLANHPDVVRAAHVALDEYGHGAGAARLLVGNFDLCERLELALADWLGTEAALVFGSGYLANVGVISALAVAGDRLFSDSLNHASIIDGCRLSRAEVEVYPHATIPAMESASDLVVTESVFSMDGDSPAFAPLLARCLETGGRLIVDEAHALGVVGDGRGLGAGATVRIGTFGKALGSYGAFVAGDRDVIELLLNTSRTFIFSTGLPAPALAAATTAVSLAGGSFGDEARGRLEARCRQLADGLANLGIPSDALLQFFQSCSARNDEPWSSPDNWRRQAC